MTEQWNVQQMAERLCAAEDILILCHKNPDGDVTLPAAEAGTLICFGRVLTGTLSNRN